MSDVDPEADALLDVLAYAALTMHPGGYCDWHTWEGGGESSTITLAEARTWLADDEDP